MEQFAVRFEMPPVLLPMSDIFVLACDRAVQDFPDWPFHVHGMGSGIRTSLTGKRTTFEIAGQYGFPCPETRFINNREEAAQFWDELGSEVLIKPDLAPAWRSGAAAAVARDRKVIVARTLDELLTGYDEMAPFTPGVLAQEVIPGDDSCLLYWCGFLGPGGEVGGSLVGRKLRVIPIHYGSASFVQLVDMPAVDAQCIRFLSRLGYRGIGGIELKEDPRDGIAKLIEVNPRYGLWDDIGASLGVDLAREAVDAFCGRPVQRRSPSCYGRKWVSVGRDLSALRQYRREGSLSIPGWLRSLTPPLYVNDFPLLTDPRFAVQTVWSCARKLFR